MKKQLSNENIVFYKFILFTAAGILLAGYLLHRKIDHVLDTPGSEHANDLMLIPALLGYLGLYYLLIGRFSRVTRDENTLQFTGLFKKGSIPLGKIEDIMVEWVPVQFFFKRAHGVTVIYQDEQGKSRTLSFLSKEIGFSESLRQSPELKELKRMIKIEKVMM